MTYATPELTGVIEHLIATAEVTRAATLEDVRAIVAGDDIFVSDEGELLHAQDRTFLVLEIDELMDLHGAKAPALDFT